jgi:hypothetical protein
MSQHKLMYGLAALLLAGSPAMAQQNKVGGTVVVPKPVPAATVKRHYVKDTTPAMHRVGGPVHVTPDTSADDLNAKELATIQGAPVTPLKRLP